MGLDNTTAKEILGRLIHRAPRTVGIDRARWRLQDLLAQCATWAVTTPGGMAGLLHRLGLTYQRGRDYVHSPDPDYLAKMAAIQAVLTQTRACTARWVALYLDELTYYRQPTVARAYAPRNGDGPHATRSHRSNTPTRVLATLNDATGQVVAWQGSKVGVDALVRFYRQLREAHPQVERLYVILDNWPVHFHPDVLVALEPQEAEWPRYVPANWPTEPSDRARRKWEAWQLPIQLLPLPTYASWEDPIEKLWRWGKQEVLHLHDLADRLDELRQRFLAFLARFADDSPELLRYVGLQTCA